MTDWSAHMWEMCDRAGTVNAEWLQKAATTPNEQVVVLIYRAMADIPPEERGDWFEQALDVARHYIKDGASRWVAGVREQLETGEGKFWLGEHVSH